METKRQTKQIINPVKKSGKRIKNNGAAATGGMLDPQYYQASGKGNKSPNKEF
jgi:hypothetical protein